MMTGLIQDQHLEKQIEKQIGCMSGFLHIFDRQQILAGKRVYSTKRLPASTVAAASPESDKSISSVKSVKLTAVRETEKPVVSLPESPERFEKSPTPLPIFEMKEGSMKSSWKLCKEMPRLSLDSRATVDSKGSLCAKENPPNCSPSVIARLMGLDQLPSSTPETVKKPMLRRSASESRVSRDLFHSKFVECNNNQAKQLNKQSSVEINLITNAQHGRLVQEPSRNLKNEQLPKVRLHNQRRSFFDSGDIFPDPKQTVSDKCLKLRGINEQTKDLQTLKHILEALHFKGLLHSNRPLTREPNFLPDDQSMVVMTKPWRSPGRNMRFGNDRYSSEVSISPSLSPRKDRGVPERGGSGRSPVRASYHTNSKTGNTIVKRKSLSVETGRRFNESASDSRRNSPVNSPKLTPKRSGSDQHSVTNRSPRSNRSNEMIYSKQKGSKNIVIEDESSSFSESSGSTTSYSDLERSKMEENRDGKSLLARCDKLLHSIAEMNSITESQTSFNSVIPSPISVLDSVFDKDDSSSPSPVMKRSIDFKDLNVDVEDDIWRSIISPAATDEEFITADDSDLTYISEIIRASKYLPDDSTVFSFLEKQKYLISENRNNSSKHSKLRRKLLFDVVGEIMDKNRQQPPWKLSNDSYVKQIWYEFQKIREPETAEDLLDMICRVLKKDLAGNNGWDDQGVEVSEAVLYIERLIFKDLVSETIRDLADFAGKTTLFAPRRKLVF